MEYKIYKNIREYFNVHIYIRLFFSVLLILFSLIPIILPLFPFSLFVGVFILIVGVLLIVPGRKVKHVIKLRKGIVYMFKNIHRRRVIKHKMNDISAHIKQILNEEKPKRFGPFHIKNKLKKKIIK